MLFRSRIGKKYNSIALEAGGKHLQSDTYSSIGLVVGLLILYFTKILWIDSALGFIFGSIIIFTGISILRKTTENLLDKADNTLLENMADCLNKNRHPDWIDIHNTKIIKYGSYLYIDMDLTLPSYYDIVQSQKSCNQLKNVLKSNFSEKFQLSIHTDPCLSAYCVNCDMNDCAARKEDFIISKDLKFNDIIQSNEERENSWIRSLKIRRMRKE